MTEMHDFSEHNRMVAALWDGFEAGRPSRVPAIFNIGTRHILLTPGLNEKGYTFEEYFADPALQWEVQLGLQKWVRENVPQDRPRGLPEAWGGPAPDFQNVYEAAWLGCEIVFNESEVPDTRPILREDKGKLAEMSLPDPLHDGLQARAWEFYQYFEERRKRDDFAGRPVGKPQFCAVGTDGPFTVACNLRGASEMCLDLYEDPVFARELLDFVTAAIIVRVEKVMEINGTAYPMAGWCFADDCIQLLSERAYREFVLPCHLRLLSVFSQGGPNAMHICGKVGHLLRVLQAELNMQDFELGFPVDLGEARKIVGEKALLKGNLHPQILHDGPVVRIEAETERIMKSGVKAGGRFIFCEGNNVAPGTPVAHMAAAYAAAKRWGEHT